jgi:4-carboxymuconolactone decarboxylase
MTDDLTKMFATWMEQSQKMAQAFTPGMTGFDPKAMEKFFPTMPRDVLEMWFGRTFNPEGLDARTRFLVTIAALTVLGPVGEPQLRLTIKNALSAGATRREIAEVIWQMSMFGGLPATQKALETAQAVFTDAPEEDDA